MKFILRNHICLITTFAVCFCSCKKQGQGSAPSGPPIIQVVVVPARKQSVAENLSLVGSIAANEMVEIKSETDGLVEKIGFLEGQSVAAGQLLVQLDDTKLAATVRETEANFKLSQANYDRSKQLFADKLISQQEFDQSASVFEASLASLEVVKRQLKDTKIHAPFEGVVGARMISPGQVITRNTTLTWLIDLDPIKAEFNVPERFLSQLQGGQKIELTVASYPDRIFRGEVFFVSPFIDADTRTALVKARIDNRDGALKPGMFANLDLTLTVRANSIVIPEAAIAQLLDAGKANVFVVDQTQTVQVRKVTPGMRLPGQIEVLSGLAEGENVIVEGIQKVGPGAKVKLAPSEASRPYLPGTNQLQKPALTPG